jgi:hypothetical protein
MKAEAETLARYLVGSGPPAEMIERYDEAHRLLLGEAGAARGEAVAGFALHNSWSLPFLDAACALLEPHNLLRSKLLLMAAILEASPDFADEFLPQDTPRAALLGKLGLLGLGSVARTVLGLLLYPVALRYRP